MKTKILVPLICLYLFNIEGCSNKNASDSGVRYLVKSFSKNFGGCDSLSNYCASLKLNYPLFTAADNDFIKDSLNNRIKRMILSPVFQWKSNTPDQLADSLFSDYKRIKKEFPDSPIRYELERKTDVLLNSVEIIALEFYEFSYLGGAHPNSVKIYTNLSPRTGREISLDELLIKGYEEKLNSVGERKFREERNIKPEDDLEKAGFWFKDNKFLLNRNFLVSNSGLRFFFNDYEIAPHSLGPTEIFISFEQIKDLINPESLLTGLH